MGAGWSVLMGLAFVPLYIRFMGIESYGLIGFYLILLGIIQVLDLGLTPTMNRELARYSVQPRAAAEVRDFVRTLEVGYWLVGLTIGAAVVTASPFLATRWIHAGTLPPGAVKHAVASMGILLALQWPITLYQGGLLGLQRQVLLNGIAIAAGTLRSGGAVLVLWLVSPTVTAFFAWQIVASAVHTAAIALALWKSLPASGSPPKVRPALFTHVRAFAGGMAGIALLSLAFTQLDKIILSRVLALAAFGYYTLAGVFSTAARMAIGPVFNALFPRLSAQVAAGDEEGLTRLYHQGSQLLAVLAFSLAAVLSLFASDIFLLWTGDPVAASTAGPVGALLVWGTAFNGLLHGPHALQLAYGWTKLCLVKSVVAVILMVPLMVVLIRHFGAMGAAASWVALNIAVVFVEVPIMHRRLLKGEMWRWYWQDLGVPLATACLLAGVGRLLIPVATRSWTSAACIGAASLATLAGTTAASPWLRAQVCLGARRAIAPRKAGQVI